MILTVGTILRVKNGHGFKVWKVTAIALGGCGHEDIIALKPISEGNGSIYGKTLEESLVPYALLTSNPNLEVVS